MMEKEEQTMKKTAIVTGGSRGIGYAAVRQMIQQEQLFACKGHIVNVGSCSAEVSSISRGEYCISKAAVSILRDCKWIARACRDSRPALSYQTHEL